MQPPLPANKPEKKRIDDGGDPNDPNVCRDVDADGFDYVTSEDVLAECRASIGDVEATAFSGSGTNVKVNGEDNPANDIDTPLYSVDSLVRRAAALQLTPEARRAAGEGAD